MIFAPPLIDRQYGHAFQSRGVLDQPQKVGASLGLRQLRRRVIGHVDGVMQLAIDSYRSRARPITARQNFTLILLVRDPGGAEVQMLSALPVFSTSTSPARRLVFVTPSKTAEGELRKFPLTGRLFALGLPLD